jgi:tRNA dimethylallyltransferase
MKDYAVAVFGPTGVGKTNIALELAEEKGEIISVDSMQVYRYMDIGTAKPSINELKKVVHHLLDIITPDVQFSAGDFKRLAGSLIPEIIKRNKVPYLVGGTGLYFKALMSGMIDIPKIDSAVRKWLLDKSAKIGQDRMYSVLQRLDKKYSEKIHHNDKHRTIRALEVIFGTKKKFSFYMNHENEKSNIKYITIGINIERRELYNDINERVDRMIKIGLIDEVVNLKKMGYTRNDPGMNAIG